MNEHLDRYDWLRLAKVARDEVSWNKLRTLLIEHTSTYNLYDREVQLYISIEDKIGKLDKKLNEFEDAMTDIVNRSNL